MDRPEARDERMTRFTAAAVVASCLGVAAGVIPAPQASAVPLLPDLFSVADENRQFMYGGTFDTTSEPSRVLYRFTTALANLGDGPFQVYEETDAAADTQDVYQDVLDSGGGFTRTLIASFSDLDTPPFGHLNFERLALYNLREVGPAMGVGDVVASHAKTSHAVVDSVGIDTALPGAPSGPVYNSAAANPLGVSVGYADLYGKSIPTQRIDVTGIPSGQYWLEVVVDPDSVVRETDETNNTTRILVDLTVPDALPTVTGDYDANLLVGQSDLDLVLLNWGDDVNVTGIPNQWVNDRASGQIGQAELDLVLLNWGNNTSDVVNAAAIPEPASLTLLGVGALARRRRRSV